MKKYFLFVCLLLISLLAVLQIEGLQDFSVSELERMLAKSQADTDRIQLLFALGRRKLMDGGDKDKKTDEVLKIAGLSIEQSRQLNFHKGIINSLLPRARCFNDANKTDKGLAAAHLALKFARELNDKEGVAESFIVIGQHYSITEPEELYRRIAYIDQAISIFRETKNLFRLANTLQDNAELLLLNRQQTDAIKLLLEAPSINKSIGYRSVQGIYWLISRTFNKNGQGKSLDEEGRKYHHECD